MSVKKVNVANSMEPPSDDATPEDATTMDPSRAVGPRTHGPADEPPPGTSQLAPQQGMHSGLSPSVRFVHSQGKASGPGHLIPPC